MKIHLFELNEFTGSCQYLGVYERRRNIRGMLSILTPPVEHSVYDIEGGAVVERWSELDHKVQLEVCYR